MDEKEVLNRKLHEALGHCYHEWKRVTVDPKSSYQCQKCWVEIKEPYNPDYVSDPRLVLREMQKREGFSCFLSFLMFGSENDCLEDELIYAEATLQIVDLILDDTGKLAQLALDWLEREKKG
jgi:hypothetical protein